MRVAVVSDIHGNLAALEAVLAAIDERAPDVLWSLGDLVGYGARPNECCAAIRERAAVSLAGNHDLAVRGTLDLHEFSGDAGVAARWTRGVLTAESQAYLESLETHGRAAGAELFHASARDEVWEYVLSDDAALATLALTTEPVVLVGHSHVPLATPSTGGGGLAPGGTTLAWNGGRTLLNPGSVGQPRDGDPRAAFLLLDFGTSTATFERVVYDIERTQSEIREAGLPEILARRLETGL